MQSVILGVMQRGQGGASSSKVFTCALGKIYIYCITLKSIFLKFLFYTRQKVLIFKSKPFLNTLIELCDYL